MHVEVAIVANNLSSFLMYQESCLDEDVYCQLRLSTEEMIHTGYMCELNAKGNDFMKK